MHRDLGLSQSTTKQTNTTTKTLSDDCYVGRGNVRNYGHRKNNKHGSWSCGEGAGFLEEIFKPRLEK
jgi:hypothetical protein